MKSIKKLQNVKITEYSLILCILLVNFWCVFLNQTLLFTFGGALVTMLDVVLCAYLIVNYRRKSVSRDTASRMDLSLIYWVLFALLYMAVFSLGSSRLPGVSVIGFNIPKQIYNMLFNVMHMLAMVAALRNMKNDERELASKVVIFVFLAVALGNIAAVAIDPSLTKTNPYDEGGSVFVLGYSMAYSLALILPAFVYKFIRSERKITYLLLIISIAISIFLAGYFIAVCTAIIAVIVTLILLIKDKLLAYGTLIIVTVAVILLLSSGILQEFFYFIGEAVPIYQLSRRFTEIADFMSKGVEYNHEGETTFRFYIYKETFENFMQHPVLGNFVFGNYDCQYDHATILDILSVGGVVLGGLFFEFLKRCYDAASTRITDDLGKRALSAAFLAYIFVACFNSALSATHLGVLVLAAPLIIGGKKDEDLDCSSL